MSRRPVRKKRSRASRLRPFWFLLVLLAAAAAFGGYYAATWPGFYPQQVAVTGNRVVPSADILARAQIEPHANIWLQNMHAASARIDALPYVRDARIHRSLPARVQITVRERTPYALLRSGATELLVDHDLRVLEHSRERGALPVFIYRLKEDPADGSFLKSDDVRRLRDDYDMLAQAHVIVTSLYYDKFGDLVGGMRGGVKLLLGDDADLAKKTPLITPILSQVAAGGRRIAAVDLRALKTPVVLYK